MGLRIDFPRWLSALSWPLVNIPGVTQLPTRTKKDVFDLLTSC